MLSTQSQLHAASVTPPAALESVQRCIAPGCAVPLLVLMQHASTIRIPRTSSTHTLWSEVRIFEQIILPPRSNHELRAQSSEMLCRDSVSWYRYSPDRCRRCRVRSSRPNRGLLSTCSVGLITASTVTEFHTRAEPRCDSPLHDALHHSIN